jgi:cytochrome c oxidase assembly factor CtaG
MPLSAADPLAFSLHPGAWVVLLLLASTYALTIRTRRLAVSRRQAWCFIGALAVLLVALTWPVADLAAHWLLVALVVQRLLLMLAFPPLFIAGVPRSLVARLTRPAPVDAVARACSRPVPAVVIVTVVAVGTLTVPAVGAQASSAIVRGLFDLLLAGAGLVLWCPVLQPVPGTERTSALGQAGYLVVQSILPSFLSIVWIFARHPLYPAYVHPHRVLGLSSLVDQQLSGFAAKLLTIFVLWAVAFVVVVRAERLSESGEDPEPLTWADVERQLERVARREARRPRRIGPPHRRHGPAARRRRQPRPGTGGRA